MDKQSQRYLESLLQKDPSELNEYQKNYMRARGKYVGRNSRRKFSNVFGKRK